MGRGWAAAVSGRSPALCDPTGEAAERREPCRAVQAVAGRSARGSRERAAEGVGLTERGAEGTLRLPAPLAASPEPVPSATVGAGDDSALRVDVLDGSPPVGVAAEAFDSLGAVDVVEEVG